MKVRRRRTAIALFAGAMAFILVACGPGEASDEISTDGARPVTTEEAQILASMRFRNFDAGARGVSFTLMGEDESKFDGWFDYSSGVGYGSVHTGDSAELLLWDDQFVGTRTAPADAFDKTTIPPLPDRADLQESWRGASLSPSSSRRDTVLAIVGSLGADRPDNPLLLQQSGALWLGERTVDDAELTVFAGPVSDEVLAEGESADPDAATTRYWVTSSGLPHRVDVRLGGESTWTSITLSEASGVDLADPFADPHS